MNDAVIQPWLERVRRRLRLAWWRRVAVAGGLLVAAGMLGVALVYLVQGLRVAWVWYVVLIGAGVLGMLLVGVWRKCTLDEAARVADQHFELQDALLSWCALREREDAMTEVQQQRTVVAVQGLDVRQIPLPPVRKWAGVAAMGMLLAGGLCFVDESEAQQVLRAEKERVQDSTEEIRALMQEVSEEIIEPLAEFDPALAKALQQMVNDLEQVDSQEEAMRAVCDAGAEAGADGSAPVAGTGDADVDGDGRSLAGA